MATSREVELLLGSKTIAVVGLSKDPSKESFSVSVPEGTRLQDNSREPDGL